jgi:hypothetical protein
MQASCKDNDRNNVLRQRDPIQVVFEEDHESAQDIQGNLQNKKSAKNKKNSLLDVDPSGYSSSQFQNNELCHDVSRDLSWQLCSIQVLLLDLQG